MLTHGGMNEEELNRLKRELTNAMTKVVKYSDEHVPLEPEAVLARTLEVAAMGVTMEPGPSGFPSAVFYALASLDPRHDEDDARLFVTRNEEFLALAERLFERFGVRPVTPEQAKKDAP